MEQGALDFIRGADEPEVTLEELQLQELNKVFNEVNDLKSKLGVTNEILLELLAAMKEEGCANHAVQARPTRHIPPPSRLLRR